MPFCLEPARVKQRTHRRISALDIRTITGGAGARAERGDMDLLKRSIARLGLISPLLVRARGDGYELIAGARRLNACRALGLSRVECVIMPALDEECMLAALAENACRAEPRAQDVLALRRELCARHGYSAGDIDELAGVQADSLDSGETRSFDCTDSRRNRRSAREDKPTSTPPRPGEAAFPAPFAQGSPPPGIPADDDLTPRRRARGYIRDERLIVNALGDVADKLRSAGVDTRMDVEHVGNSLRVQVVFPGVGEQNHIEKSLCKGEHSVEFSNLASKNRQISSVKTENHTDVKCERMLKISDIGRELKSLQADEGHTSKESIPDKTACIARSRRDSDNVDRCVRVLKCEHTVSEHKHAGGDAVPTGIDNRHINQCVPTHKGEHTDCDSRYAPDNAAVSEVKARGFINPAQGVRTLECEHSVSEFECTSRPPADEEASECSFTGMCAPDSANLHMNVQADGAAKGDLHVENQPAPDPLKAVVKAVDSEGAVNSTDTQAAGNASPTSAEEYVMQLFREEMARGISGTRAAYDGA